MLKLEREGGSCKWGREHSVIDYGSARRTMVNTQLRTHQVTDRRVLAAFSSIPREAFVPPAIRPLAYMEGQIEVQPSIDGSEARYLLGPATLARLVQLGEIGASERVLDVGCATGYSAAILSRLAGEVIALEADAALASAARSNLAALGIENAAVVEGNLAEGAPQHGPCEVILLNGSVREPPEGLFSRLKEGGRLVGVIARPRPGHVVQGKACRFVMVQGEASGLPHFDANAKPLPGFAPAPLFAFWSRIGLRATVAAIPQCIDLLREKAALRRKRLYLSSAPALWLTSLAGRGIREPRRL
jgi:protein-L-isoaspartate(D-aspartate) O-methyltransferase